MAVSDSETTAPTDPVVDDRMDVDPGPADGREDDEVDGEAEGEAEAGTVAGSPEPAGTTAAPTVDGDGADPADGGEKTVKRRGGRRKERNTALKREGLAKTNNGLTLSSWPQIAMINQKNYYTDYLKREDQFLSYRTAREQALKDEAERALAASREREGEIPTTETEDRPANGSRVIVIHPGSQNLRIGFAYEALPKTVPMVVARRISDGASEAESDPRPRRAGRMDDEDVQPHDLFGPGFAAAVAEMAADLKRTMKANRRRMLPNSQELVVNYNRKTMPTPITEHNDFQTVDWTDTTGKPAAVFGEAALRIADKQTKAPGSKYRLFWPVRYGLLNEGDEYKSGTAVWEDFFAIIEWAIRTQLGLDKQRSWKDYSVCFVVPDLYDRLYVTNILGHLLHTWGFSRVCFLQESVAATFGAGYSMACIVDVGAQSTTVCCVDDGLCVEDSRLRLSMGGSDVTEALIRMSMLSGFPHKTIDLNRRQDWTIAEDVKKQYCTLDDGAVAGVTAKIHLRAPGRDTLQYVFKMYQEPMLAALVLFDPDVLNAGPSETAKDKDSDSGDGASSDGAPPALSILHGRHGFRRRLLPASVDLYDNSANDPFSTAQGRVLQISSSRFGSAHHESVQSVRFSFPTGPTNGDGPAKSVVGQLKSQVVADSTGTNTPRSAGSPAAGQSRAGSTEPTADLTPGQSGSGDPAALSSQAGGSASAETDPATLKARLASTRDLYAPVMPIDEAVSISIAEAARGDDRRARDLLGSIMVVGGGAMVPGFLAHLQQRLRAKDPVALAAAANGITFPEAGPGRRGAPPRDLDPKELVIIGAPPRDMDPQVVVWKGGSVFARLSSSGNECWIRASEYELLGAKMLAQKSMWNW